MIRFDHRAGHLYHGDALALLAALPDDSVDLVCTDPPYKVITGGRAASNAAGRFVMYKDNDQLFKHNDVKIADYMPQFYRVLKPGSHCYVMINNLNLRDLLNVADAVGFGFHNLLRWDKNNNSPNRWYMKDCEYTLLFYKRPSKTINNPGSKQGFKVANIASADRIHPTQKPVELMHHYITNSSDPGAVVLDPFAGAGSTLIAAAESGRRFIGCEIDPAYYIAAMGRLQGV